MTAHTIRGCLVGERHRRDLRWLALEQPKLRRSTGMIFRSALDARNMHHRGPLHLLRTTLAGLLGISDERSGNGTWWEIDLILVVLAGAMALGVFAWLEF